MRLALLLLVLVPPLGAVALALERGTPATQHVPAIELRSSTAADEPGSQPQQKRKTQEVRAEALAPPETAGTSTEPAASPTTEAGAKPHRTRPAAAPAQAPASAPRSSSSGSGYQLQPATAAAPTEAAVVAPPPPARAGSLDDDDDDDDDRADALDEDSDDGDDSG